MAETDPARSSAPDEISREEVLSRRGDSGFVLVNVLPVAAFDRRRIPGSVSLPLAALRARAADVVPDRRTEIAVHCTGPS